MSVQPYALTISAWLRWDAVSRRLPLDPRSSILEIGCGLGGLSQLLAERFPYAAVETDAVAAAAAGERVRPYGGTVLHGDLSALEPSFHADVVCAFEVIEHIEDDRAALAEWASRVTPGGRLILTTPSHPERFGRWDSRVGHWRRYDAQAIVERLESVGLTDVEAQCYGGPVSFALDTVRQQVPKLYPHRDLGNHHEATMKSGQLLQPRGALAGRLMHLGSYPAVALARAFPGRGAGLIAVGRRPN